MFEFDISAMRAALSRYDVKGCSVSIVQQNFHGEWGVGIYAFGKSGVENDRILLDTMFYIGDNSKLFCALAMALALEEAGYQNGFQTRIIDIVPDYRLDDTDCEEWVTIGHALSQTLGMPAHEHYSNSDVSTLEDQVRSDVPAPKYNAGCKPAHHRGQLEIIKCMKQSTELETGYQSHDAHYDLMALIIEKIAGIPYEQYLKEKILSPIALNSTSTSAHAMASSPLPTRGFWQYGETSENPGETIMLSLNMKDESVVNMGARRISTTPNDMARWMQILLGNGRDPHTQEQLLPESIIKYCKTNMVIPFHEHASLREYPELGPASYGYGLSRHVYRDRELLEHGGAFPGYTNRLCLVPEDDFGVFIMTNSDPWGELACEEIKYGVLDFFFRLPQIEWHSRLWEEKMLRLMQRHIYFTEALALPEHVIGPLVNAEDLVGVYHSPAFHQWVIGPEHILDHPPEQLFDLPRMPYLTGHVQPLLWHWSGTQYRMCWEFHFPPEVGKDPLLGMPLDIELDIDGPGGPVRGFGVRGIWGAPEGVPPPSGPTVKDRAEMYFTKV